jgi:hypothetical protein
MFLVVRGIVLTWSVTGAPLLVALLLMPLSALVPHIDRIVSICLMIWKVLIFPHDDLYTASGRVLAGVEPTLLAFVQWSVVSIVVGWSTRRQSLRRQLAAAVAAVLLVSLTTIGVAVLCGFRPVLSQDSPSASRNKDHRVMYGSSSDLMP